MRRRKRKFTFTLICEVEATDITKALALVEHKFERGKVRLGDMVDAMDHETGEEWEDYHLLAISQKEATTDA